MTFFDKLDADGRTGGLTLADEERNLKAEADAAEVDPFESTEGDLVSDRPGLVLVDVFARCRSRLDLPETEDERTFADLSDSDFLAEEDASAEAASAEDARVSDLPGLRR